MKIYLVIEEYEYAVDYDGTQYQFEKEIDSIYTDEAKAQARKIYLEGQNGKLGLYRKYDCYVDEREVEE